MITAEIHIGHVRAAVERDLEWIAEHEAELRGQFEGREPQSIWLMVSWEMEHARQAIYAGRPKRLTTPEARAALRKLRVTLDIAAAWLQTQEAE